MKPRMTYYQAAPDPDDVYGEVRKHPASGAR
jgi:hypothetical protein